MDALDWTIYDSPLGPLTVLAGPDGVRSVHFPGDRSRLLSPTGLQKAIALRMAEVVEQLDEYFAGERQGFDLDIDLRGEPLQLAVWERLREIPFGQTASYGEIAAEIDGSLFPADLEPYRRVRLAGTEIGRTPTPILVPCHRVIGADGSLTGYGGGLDRKRALLELESSVLSPRLC